MTAETHSTTGVPARSVRQDQAVVRVLEALVNMPGGVLDAVQPLLMDLADIDGQGLSDAALRRLAMRVFFVERHRQLRRSLEHQALSQRRLVTLLNRDAIQIDPSWKCSPRALQVWIRAWNRPAADGIAEGWRGLICPCSSPKRRHFGCPGRKPSRSPEAIAFFDRHYLGGGVQKLAVLHRRTLAEAAPSRVGLAHELLSYSAVDCLFWDREKGRREAPSEADSSGGRTAFGAASEFE